MTATRLALAVELPVLHRKVSWADLEALIVELSHRAASATSGAM